MLCSEISTAQWRTLTAARDCLRALWCLLQLLLNIGLQFHEVCGKFADALSEFEWCHFVVVQLEFEWTFCCVEFFNSRLQCRLMAQLRGYFRRRCLQLTKQLRGYCTVVRKSIKYKVLTISNAPVNKSQPASSVTCSAVRKLALIA